MEELTLAERRILSSIRRLPRQSPTPVLIALDGRTGVGKSTIASRLAAEVRGIVIDGDQFFSGGSDDAWRSRTPEQRVEGAIDWRRLCTEVLEPLRAGQPAAWGTRRWMST